MEIKRIGVESMGRCWEVACSWTKGWIAEQRQSGSEHIAAADLLDPGDPPPYSFPFLVPCGGPKPPSPPLESRMTPKVPYGLGRRPLPPGGALTTLPFYAILRSIPSKTFGILAMAGALLLLATLPLEQRAVAVGGLVPGGLLGWREAPNLSLPSSKPIGCG